MKPLAILLVFAIGLVAGLGWLYSLLFSTGGAYPPYSSLRADPVGSRVLYESIASLDGRAVRRQFRRPWTLDGGEKPDLWFFLGASAPSWEYLSVAEAAFLVETVRSGTTVVVAFKPTLPPEEEDATDSSPEAEPVPEIETGAEAPTQSPRPTRLSTLLGLELVQFGTEAGRASEPFRADDTFRQWRLRPLTDAWQTRRRDELGALWVERRLGDGRLVFLADSFPLSNEGLAYARDPELVAALLGDAREIWFDEWHLGLVENPGVGTLLARYGLLPALATLLVAGALYAWRTASPLIPPSDVHTATGSRQTREGFLSLIRRSIAPAALPGACWQAWRKTMPAPPHRRDQQADQILAAETLLGREDLPPLQKFHQLNQLISKEKDPS